MSLPYPESFLSHAQDNLGEMFDYAVNTKDYDINNFHKLFLKSSVSNYFENGNIQFILGMTGIELFYHIVWELKIKTEDFQYGCHIATSSDEYRAGSLLAFFQYWSNKSFVEINNYFSMDKFVEFSRLWYDYDDDEIFHKIMNEIIKIEYKNCPKFLSLYKLD